MTNPTLFSSTNSVTVCTTKAYYLHTSLPTLWLNTTRHWSRAGTVCKRWKVRKVPLGGEWSRKTIFPKTCLVSWNWNIWNILFLLRPGDNTLKTNEIQVKQKHTECLFLKNGPISCDILRGALSPSNSTSLTLLTVVLPEREKTQPGTREEAGSNLVTLPPQEPVKSHQSLPISVRIHWRFNNTSNQGKIRLLPGHFNQVLVGR